MKIFFVILIMFLLPTLSFANKIEEIQQIESIESEVINKIKYSDTNNEQILEDLILDKLPPIQLFCLGIRFAILAYPQNAGEETVDLIFENIAWKCAYLLSLRSGHESAHYLSLMKNVFGNDGGDSLRFKELIKKQSKL